MINYIPKGSMCIKCKFKERTCNNLNFRKMKPHKQIDESTVQVICSGFKKELKGDELSN